MDRTGKRRARFAFLAALGLAASVFAAPASRAQDAKPSWQPKAPDGLPADFDWIRLPSDEWLKGEIVSMYDGKLEFDSDELGLHTFDFADIKELRSSRVVQVGFTTDRAPLTGRLVVDGANARVIAEAGETAFARSEILTIVIGAAKEIDYWSGYANVGGNIRSGNSEQVDYTARLGTMRRAVRDRTAFEYIGNITRINSEDTSNNHRVALGWDRFLSNRLFLNLVGLEWYRDPFQNVANRWTVTAGLGYQITRHSPHDLERDGRPRLAVQRLGQRSPGRRGPPRTVSRCASAPSSTTKSPRTSTSTPTTAPSSPRRRRAAIPTISTLDWSSS